jgi:mannosyltransferase OCH1-like enzyme
VYKYGGFYLDTDVEVLKDFSPLLDFEYVLGMENSDRKYIEAATFGSLPGNVFLQECMDSYHNRHFIKEDGTYDYEFMIPHVMKQNIKDISILNDLSDYQSKSTSTQVFASKFFSPKNCDTSELDKLTNQTFSIHHFRGSWFPLNMRLNRFIWKHLSNKQARFVQNCYQKIKSLFHK